jgi:ABC-type multidrug transport system ATPase subunit
MNGCVNAGETVAILGGSGAGKSSLLNCISGRLSSGKVFGQVHLNGKDRDSHKWKKTVSYVEQDDLLFTNLTVHETFMYSARLRLPSSVSTEEKTKIVDRIIQQLGLQGCKDTRIGDRDNRGISGGERKRVSIGIELVTDPKVIFLV